MFMTRQKTSFSNTIIIYKLKVYTIINTCKTNNTSTAYSFPKHINTKLMIILKPACFKKV